MKENSTDQGKHKTSQSPQANWWKIGFLFLLLILIAVGAFYAGTQLSQKDITEKIQPTTSLEDITDGKEKKETKKVEKAKSFTAGKVFFPKDNNLFSYDVQTKATTKLTDFQASDDKHFSFQSLRVVDGNTLGFGKCETVTGDFGCGIFTLDLKTKNISTKKDFDAKTMIDTVDFFNTDRYAYVTYPDTRWQVVLVNNGTETLLEDLEFVGGRGGFIEDSNKLRFSPDGKTLMHISTGSPRNITDFNVYFYKVPSGDKDVLSDATQPAWLDNDTVIYRKFNGTEGDGLYTYNVANKTLQKIEETPKYSYHPELAKNSKMILYEAYNDKKLWLYDMNAKTNTLVADNAVLGFFITPDIISFTEIEPCAGDECGMLDYATKGEVIYNLTQKQTLEAFSPDTINSYTSATAHH